MNIAPAVSSPAAQQGSLAPALPGAPRHSAASLVRVAALCAAVAAGLFGPTVLAGHGGIETSLVIGVVTLFTLGATLFALRGRIAAPRTVRAWLFWGAGSLVLSAVASISLGGALLALLAQEGAAVAYAATFCWALAVGLNGLQARHAFDLTRGLGALRLALYRVASVVLVMAAAVRVADLAQPPLLLGLRGTPAESLVPGAAIVLALLLGLLALAAAWRLPAALAQRQFDGRLAASAAGESLWFAGLAPLLMPWAMADVPPLAAATPLAAGPWAEIALHVLTVVLAHGAVRIVFGSAGSVPPVPLLVLMHTAQPTAAARTLLARLPAAWGAGPLCVVRPPPAAVQHHGAHLQLAALAGGEALLFPQAAQDVVAWRDALPPWQHWRALPTQELYAEPTRWRAALQAWVNPQTWVLLVQDGSSMVPAPYVEDWADALPAGRTVRLNVGTADDGRWPRLLAHGPVFAEARGDAAVVADWLRQQVRPDLPRRIVLLHARADALLANALADQLDGRADAQGRFVEAWTLPAHGQVDWRIPLTALRLLAQVQYSHTQHQLQAEPPPPLRERVRLQAQSGAARAWLGWRPLAEPPAYDVVLLHTEALRDAARGWQVPAPELALLALARRRLGLRLDRSADALCPLDAQINAPLSDPSALDAAAGRAQAARLAEQILADAWVALAVPRAVDAPLGRDAGPLSDVAGDADLGRADPTAAVPLEATAPVEEAPAEASPAVESPAGEAVPTRLLLVHGGERPPAELVRVLQSEFEVGVRRIDEPEALTLLGRVWLDACVLLTSPDMFRGALWQTLVETAGQEGLPLLRIEGEAAELPSEVGALPRLGAWNEPDTASTDEATVTAQTVAAVGATARAADALAIVERLRQALQLTASSESSPGERRPTK